MYSPAVPRDYAALKEGDDYRTMLLTVRETVAYQGFLAQSVLERAEALHSHIQSELDGRR